MTNFDDDIFKLKDNEGHDWQLPEDLEDSITSELRKRDAFKQKGSGSIVWIKAIAAILLLSVSFVSGWLLAKQNDVPAEMPAQNKQFALLLYEGDDFEKNANKLNDEYATWFSDNQQRGLEYGMELAAKGWLINTKQVTRKANPSEMVLSGFFILRASDTTAALHLANTCPHLKYNGTMELREVLR